VFENQTHLFTLGSGGSFLKPIINQKSLLPNSQKPLGLNSSQIERPNTASVKMSAGISSS